MTLTEQFILLIIYRLVPIGLGVLVIWWGYKLFNKGIMLASAGNVKAMWGDMNIVIKNAAPGTFLFIVGGFAIIASIWKGGEIKTNSKNVPSKNNIQSINLSEDSTQFTSSKQINIDSVFSIAKIKLNKGEFLNAYKYLYFTKGLLHNKVGQDSLKKEVEFSIRLAQRDLTNLLDSKMDNELLPFIGSV